jgi:hypothetical protein
MLKVVLYIHTLDHITCIFLRNKATPCFFWTDVNSKYESFNKELFHSSFIFLFIPLWISNTFIPLWHDNKHLACLVYIHFQKRNPLVFPSRNTAGEKRTEFVIDVINTECRNLICRWCLRYEVSESKGNELNCECGNKCSLYCEEYLLDY